MGSLQLDFWLAKLCHVRQRHLIQPLLHRSRCWLPDYVLPGEARFLVRIHGQTQDLHIHVAWADGDRWNPQISSKHIYDVHHSIHVVVLIHATQREL